MFVFPVHNTWEKGKLGVGELEWLGCVWLIKGDLELPVGRKVGRTLSVGNVETQLFSGHPTPLTSTAHGLMQSRDCVAPRLDLWWNWGILSVRMKAQELNSEGSLIEEKSAFSFRKLSLQSDEVCTEHWVFVNSCKSTALGPAGYPQLSLQEFTTLCGIAA